MSPTRRINVSSGRPLEHLAHYSRALRVGDTVLQSGTTAIDTEGNVIGEGDVARQVDAIVELARWSMGKAGGRLDDVVRSRIYVTDAALGHDAALALAKHLGDAAPASTLVAVNRLARPAQLVEIEFDAVDGARERAERFSSGRPSEARYGYSRAVRVDDRIFVSGSTALGRDGAVAAPGDLYRQTRVTLDAIGEALEAMGGAWADVAYTKTFVTDIGRAAEQRRAKLELLGSVRPTGTLLGIPALIDPAMLVEIEAEAIVGAGARRRDLYTGNERERALGYARAVEVGDRVYVSGCTALGPDGVLGAEGDWAGQYDLCHEAIVSALARAGASPADVVRKRIFTVDAAQMNRPYGEGPPWFAECRPASLGCRVAALAHAGILVEVEAMAIKGAGADIEWVGPEGQ